MLPMILIAYYSHLSALPSNIKVFVFVDTPTAFKALRLYPELLSGMPSLSLLLAGSCSAQALLPPRSCP